MKLLEYVGRAIWFPFTIFASKPVVIKPKPKAKLQTLTTFDWEGHA